MAENSPIEWTDHTVNFWWGCTKVSPACANCYAEAMDKRFHPFDGAIRCDKQGRFSNEQPHWGDDAPRLTRTDEARKEAMRYERRAVKEGRRFRVFTNSMSDFFEDRSDLVEARQEALDTIMSTPHLDWLILTKRPENIIPALQEAQRRALGGDVGQFYATPGTNGMSEWLGWWLSGKPPANVWLGTTVEDQERADQRVPALLQVPAAVRFLSCEPLLGPVVLPNWINLPRPVVGDWPIGHNTRAEAGVHKVSMNPHGARAIKALNGQHLGIKPGECEDLGLSLDWVICGGESGPKARPMHPDWARGLRDQCAAAGVPFLFKQWGEWAPFVNEDHYTHGGAERHPHAWIEVSGKLQGLCWIVDDDGTWSNFTGKPPLDSENELPRTVAVMGRHGKKAAGRLLDGVEHNGFPEVAHG